MANDDFKFPHETEEAEAKGKPEEDFEIDIGAEDEIGRAHV